MWFSLRYQPSYNLVDDLRDFNLTIEEETTFPDGSHDFSGSIELPGHFPPETCCKFHFSNVEMSGVGTSYSVGGDVSLFE